MNIKYTSDADTKASLVGLKDKWLESLTSPQDDYWEYLRENSKHWEIRTEKELIGYACVNGENELLQFYILPSKLSIGASVFIAFINQNNIKKGVVGTNNPIYLSMALNFVNTLTVDAYLFRQNFTTKIKEKADVFKKCNAKTFDKLVDFNHDVFDTSKDWLKNYLGRIMETGAIFYLEKENQIIGTCEVRMRETARDYMDVGMLVAPDFRRQGYGTYLLNKAKLEAQKLGKIPICACEKENIGSFKAISNCGFVSTHQLLSIEFET